MDLLQNVLDDIREDKNQREKEQKPKPAQLNTEDLLLQAIMAKMTTKSTNVEENRRPLGDSLRPSGSGSRVSTSPPPRFESTLSDKIPKPDKVETSVSHQAERKITELLVNKDRKSGGNLEVEASFGLFEDGKFKPGLRSHSDFTNLINFLHSTKSPVFQSVNTEDIIEISKDNKGNIRCQYDIENPTLKFYERKYRDTKTSVSIPNLGVRVSRSNEQAEDTPEDWKPFLRRKRRRISFFTTDSKSKFKGFAIDLTVVQEEELFWDKDDDKEILGRSYKKYEVEIEVKDRKIKVGDFISLIEYVYRASIANMAPLSKPKVKDESLFDMKTRAYVVNLHNTLFERDIRAAGKNWQPSGTYQLYSATYWNKPKNIKLTNMQPMTNKYGKTTYHLANSSVTVKLDGKRFFMLAVKSACWLIIPPYTISRFGELLNDEYDGTYLDGEFIARVDEKGKVVDYTYHVFDILFYKGMDVRRKNFASRLELVKEVSPHLSSFYGKINVKRFYTRGTIYQRMKNAAEEYKKLREQDPEITDGLIIQPSHWYQNNDTYKWKPAEQLTIDFKLFPANDEDVEDEDLPRITNENKDRAFILGVKNRDEIELFTPSYPVKYTGEIILTKDEMKKEQWADTVAECIWNHDREQFIPIKLRDDRIHPNNLDTAKDIWIDIHQPIKLSTLVGEDLVLMRKFHNRVKEQLLNNFLNEGDTIIDIGSGRGGDLTKWRKLGLEKVYAIEPNSNEKDGYPELIRRLNEDEKRFGESMPIVNVIKKGAENTKYIKKQLKGEVPKAIVSFFSMTFFGQSLELWNKLFETIDLIPDKGYFIGAVMDGERVYNLLTKEREWLTYTPDELEQQASDIQDEMDRIVKKDLFANFENEKVLSMEEEIFKLREEAKIRREGDFQPLGDEEAVVYKSKSFEIAQTSEFDLSAPDRNEIEITINDETSMVKNQTEWLFNYELFSKRLESMGFVKVTSFHLDGPDAQYLPKDSFTFSSLNIAFCFQRKPKESKQIIPTKPGDVKTFQNNYEEDLIVMGVRQTNSGFIHAFLQSINDNYQKLSSSEQDQEVLNVRKDLSESLTIEKFQKLHKGELAKRMAYEIEKETKKEIDSMQEAYEKFKRKLTDSKVKLSEVSLLELLSDKFGISIYIINSSSGKIEVYQYTSKVVQCKKILNHETAVVILSVGDLVGKQRVFSLKGEKYYPIGRKVLNTYNFIFDRFDEFIENLYSEVC